jgi:hypothetical protein
VESQERVADGKGALVVVSDLPIEGDTSEVIARLTARTPTAISRRVEDLCEEANERIDIQAVYRSCTVQQDTDERVIVGGTSFRSGMLSEQLTDAAEAFPFVITCGSEVDALAAAAGGAFWSYCVETVAHVRLRGACAALLHRIQSAHSLQRLVSMSPGTGRRGLWAIEEQRPLFGLLGDVEAAIDVRLTGDYMMIPRKTVSGIAYPSASGFISCEHCDREDCEDRVCPADGLFGG